MHTAKLSLGVVILSLSLYFFLCAAYPFASFDYSVGSFQMFTSGLMTGILGSLLCWNAVLALEEKKVDRKLGRKRKRAFLLPAKE